MNKITTFDRTNLRELRAAVEKALAAVGAEYGVGFTMKPFRFNASTFRVTMEAAVLGDAKDAREATLHSDFGMYAALYDLTAADYGKRFTSRGHEYTLVGINPAAPKYPFIGARSDGKRFRFTSEALRRAGIIAAPTPSPSVI